MLGIDLTRGRGGVEGALGQVGNVLTGHKGVGVFGSALLRCKLARNRARGFGSGIGCSGMILMTWK